MCTKFHRSTLSTTCFLMNAIFAHWTTNLTIDDVIIQDCILISEGHLNTCAKFQRNTWSKTYFLTNGIFRHWSINLTIDDVITQERAIVFS